MRQGILRRVAFCCFQGKLNVFDPVHLNVQGKGLRFKTKGLTVYLIAVRIISHRQNIGIKILGQVFQTGYLQSNVVDFFQSLFVCADHQILLFNAFTENIASVSVGVGCFIDSDFACGHDLGFLAADPDGHFFFVALDSFRKLNIQGNHIVSGSDLVIFKNIAFVSLFRIFFENADRGGHQRRSFYNFFDCLAVSA